MSVSTTERTAGLDRALPAGERILWQGKPAPGALTRSMFRLRGLAIYCTVAAAVVFAAALRTRNVGPAIAETTLLLPFFALGWGLLALVGRASARATTYTLTNRRVILHIGVAYEMTISVPLSTIVNASLRRCRDGSGEIALAVKDVGDTRYVALWPHARFGHFLAPQPMLRGLTDPDVVAEALGEALLRFNAGGRRATAMPTPAPARLAEAVAA